MHTPLYVKHYNPQFLYGHAECANTRRLMGCIFDFHFQFRFMARFMFPYYYEEDILFDAYMHALRVDS